MLHQYRVKLWTNPDAWDALFFDCQANDWNHAAAQALKAYPLGMLQSIYIMVA